MSTHFQTRTFAIVVLIIGSIFGITYFALRYVEKIETKKAEKVETSAQPVESGWDPIGVQLDGAIRMGCIDESWLGKGVTLSPIRSIRERCIRYVDETTTKTVPCESRLWFPRDKMWPVTTKCGGARSDGAR